MLNRVIFVIMALVLMFSLGVCGARTADDYSEPERKTEFSESEVSEESFVSVAPTAADDMPAGARAMTPPQPEGEISVVVLGDSIARGHGLRNIETERFSAVLGDLLRNKYAAVNVYNYAHDGYNGTNLLNQIRNTSAEEIKNAECILISIGGNNVLNAFSVMGEAFGFSGLDPNLVLQLIEKIANNEFSVDSDLELALDTLENLIKRINKAFESKEYERLITEAGEKLYSEIPQIVKALRVLNPDARIYIQTVYNPYHNVSFSIRGADGSINLSHHGERAVSKLNEAIESLAEENGYTVVPVHDAFAESENSLTNAGYGFLKLCFSADPHPNASGHALMGQIYYEYLTETENG